VSDVLVLGGGIVGVAIAGELARRGAQVTLVEAREIGSGATRASAGMLAPYTEAQPGTVLSALCEEGLACYDEAVARARRDSGREVEYTRTGTVEVALDAGSAEHFRDAAGALQARNIEAVFFDAAASLAREPLLTRATLGSLDIATQGFVAVTPFLVALAAAAEGYGARIVSGAKVERVRRGASGIEVTTDRGLFGAEHVVMATGSWSGRIEIEGEARPDVRPVRGQLLELRPRTPGPARILWGPRCYLVPWASGALLVGATVEEVGFDERATVDGVAQLMTAAIELVPALAEATFVEARVGLRPASGDGLPIIGQSPAIPGLVYATGHYRNGVLLAPLTALIVADLVLEGRRHFSLDAVGPSRFATRPRP
jgi:glycine oxidase